MSLLIFEYVCFLSPRYSAKNGVFKSIYFSNRSTDLGERFDFRWIKTLSRCGWKGQNYPDLSGLTWTVDYLQVNTPTSYPRAVKEVYEVYWEQGNTNLCGTCGNSGSGLGAELVFRPFLITSHLDQLFKFVWSSEGELLFNTLLKHSLNSGARSTLPV